MANAKELRKQIGSIKNTQKITSAMQMVAASKMRKAQERMSRGRPYSDHMRTSARGDGSREVRLRPVRELSERLRFHARRPPAALQHPGQRPPRARLGGEGQEDAGADPLRHRLGHVRCGNGARRLVGSAVRTILLHACRRSRC